MLTSCHRQVSNVEENSTRMKLWGGSSRPWVLTANGLFNCSLFSLKSHDLDAHATRATSHTTSQQLQKQLNIQGSSKTFKYATKDLQQQQQTKLDEFRVPCTYKDVTGVLKTATDHGHYRKLERSRSNEKLQLKCQHGPCMVSGNQTCTSSSVLGASLTSNIKHQTSNFRSKPRLTQLG